MTWHVIRLRTGVVHVVPDRDLRNHDPTGKCWCRPDIEDAGRTIVHNSMDGRELFETGQRKAS